MGSPRTTPGAATPRAGAGSATNGAGPTGRQAQSEQPAEARHLATLDLVGVGKRYASRRGSTVAIADVTVRVAPGEFVAIVGSSGCGKTTLLKAIAGLVPLSAGEVLVDGSAVTGPRRDIGLAFQQPRLLPWRTVLSNILLVAQIQRLDRKAATRRAHELLELVGLEGYADRYPHELSGGMQQRVGVARALVNEPSLLLMDEPFAALDALTRERMGLELLRIWQASRRTVLFVTHSLPEATLLADRVICMGRPPNSVIATVDIDLPRPRGLDDMETLKFTETVGRLRRLLFGEPAKDAAITHETEAGVDGRNHEPTAGRAT